MDYYFGRTNLTDADGNQITVPANGTDQCTAELTAALLSLVTNLSLYDPLKYAYVRQRVEQHHKYCHRHLMPDHQIVKPEPQTPPPARPPCQALSGALPPISSAISKVPLVPSSIKDPIVNTTQQLDGLLSEG